MLDRRQLDLLVEFGFEQHKLDIMSAMFGGDHRRKIAFALAVAREQRLHGRARLRQRLAPQQGFRAVRGLEPRHGFRQGTLNVEPCRAACHRSMP